MSTRTQISILCENTAVRPGVLGEFGFSAWVESGSRGVLFDTGAGDTLAHNADRMGIALAKVEAVVLSHGHDDHTAGLGHVLEVAPAVRLFAHPAALEQKYTVAGDGPLMRDGVPPHILTLLRERETIVIPTKEPTEVLPGITATGEIPRTNDFETDASARYRDPGGQKRDSLPDDQALVVDTPRGSVVVVGCAHAGVINTLDHVRENLGVKRIRAVVGGMHLIPAGEDRLARTIEGLRRLEVDLVVPMHCTGLLAGALFRRELGDRCLFSGAGGVLEFS